MTGSDRVRRLRWLCRRGMKELDILLEDFVTRNRDALEQGAWPELEGLLQSEDDRLWDWVLNPADPAGAAYLSLLDAIRSSRA